MKEHVFINSENYEIMDNVIEVDKEIAEAVCVLNKKGYITEYSCSGHIQDKGYDEQRPDKEFLNEAKIKEDFNEYYIEDVTDKDFLLLSKGQITQIYIKFKEAYIFENIPQGFTSKIDKNFERDGMYISISKDINYYDNKGIRISDEKILEEIKKYNKLLLKWASFLPDIKERND